MENFDWTHFTVKIAIKAKIEKIYSTWSTAEIENWFLSEAKYLDSNDNQNKVAQVGDVYFWRWFLYEATESGKITEANGKDIFEFTFAGDCMVTISLTEESEYVVVTLTQKNIPTDDKSKKNIRLGCHDGWSFYLVNLKSVYEGGLDLRNKDDRFKFMLNS